MGILCGYCPRLRAEGSLGTTTALPVQRDVQGLEQDRKGGRRPLGVWRPGRVCPGGGGPEALDKVPKWEPCPKHLSWGCWCW